jgi:carbamoyltransferase
MRALYTWTNDHRNEELTQNHKDIAASVQKVCENLIIHILNNLQKRTGQKNICIAKSIDDIAFAASGLAKLIENVPDENNLF